MDTIGAILIALFIFFILGVMANRKGEKMTPDEVKKHHDAKWGFTIPAETETSKWGPIKPAYICPHCQTKGSVRTMPVKRKQGISGAKATGAVLTLGVSMLATGLSRKETMTQAHCDNCNSTWDF